MATKIELLSGPPGCGKSHANLKSAISQPGKYFFCAPTTALIDEQIEIVLKAGVRAYRCDSGQHSRSPVTRQLADTLSSVREQDLSHVVVFITHATMFATDPAAFQDWHIMIDEAPDGLKTGQLDLRTDHSRAVFADLFDLDILGDWAHAKPKLKAPSWKAADQDDLFRDHAEFLRLAERPYGLFVRTKDWSEDKIDWLSLWSPLSFEQAASIRIAAASYKNSLAFKAAHSWFGVKVSQRTISRAPRASHASVTVRYFTEGHEGSSAFWQTSTGRRMIRAVCDHLGALSPSIGFWSGNEEVQKLMEWRVGDKGSLTKPKLAGQNRYAKETSCAFIYSSKPLPGDAVLADLFELTDADILAAREDEDIYQFVMRGAVRNPAFGGRYEAYVYSKRQADTLAERLAGDGFVVDITGVPEAGIMHELRVQSESRQVPQVKSVQRVPNARGTGERLLKSAKRQMQRQAKKLSDGVLP